MQVLISQIQELFRVHDGPRTINEKHIERWSHSYGLNRASLYDAIAAELALGFNNGTLDYEFCDAVEDNSLFWQVFLAFDAGEYGHNGEPRRRTGRKIHPAGNRKNCFEADGVIEINFDSPSSSCPRLSRASTYFLFNTHDLFCSW